jgi:hypothetical protein
MTAASTLHGFVITTRIMSHPWFHLVSDYLLEHLGTSKPIGATTTSFLS